MHLEQVLTQGLEPGHSAQRPGEVADERRRNDPVLRRHGAIRRHEAGGDRLATDRAQEPALADAGFARQQQQPTAALGGFREAAFREIQQVVAPDQDGTQD